MPPGDGVGEEEAEAARGAGAGREESGRDARRPGPGADGACGTAGENPQEAAGAGAHLSKRAAKRAAKRESMKETKHARKAAAKERRRERKRKEREDAEREGREAGGAAAAAAATDKPDKLSSKAARCIRRRTLESARPMVVLDLDWYAEMTERETRSCFSQISQAYGANGRAERPVQLWLCGLRAEGGEDRRRNEAQEGGAAGEPPGPAPDRFDCWRALGAQLRDVGSWAVKLEHAEDWAAALAGRGGRLVYLTADSENLLDEIDEGSTYVIGALVDRNRLKHCTVKKARRLGMDTARLPLREHAHLWRGGTPHLTVNQVLELILARRACPDWASALSRVLPPRKTRRDGEAAGGAAPA